MVNKYAVPAWVYAYVCAVVSGAGDRRGEVAPRLCATYARLDRAVANGLSVACEPGEIEIIRDAIANKKGYLSCNNYPGGHKRFYRIKRKATYEIARRLNVI